MHSQERSTQAQVCPRACVDLVNGCSGQKGVWIHQFCISEARVPPVYFAEVIAVPIPRQ